MPSRSRKSKKKTNNTADDATLGVNERILNEVKKIYVGREGEIAIEEIARFVLFSRRRRKKRLTKQKHTEIWERTYFIRVIKLR